MWKVITLHRMEMLSLTLNSVRTFSKLQNDTLFIEIGQLNQMLLNITLLEIFIVS